MLKVQIEGMTCGGCARSIENALKKNSSVKAVQVNLEGKYATVEGAVNPQEIVNQIINLGFGANVAES